MGVIKRGILGGFSGSVGNVVGSSWKGIATMKAKPLSVANPNTAGQVAQRSKMSNIVAFSKDILSTIIKPLNDRFASAMSGYNLFVQRNIALFANEYPNPQANLILSSGNVATAEVITADVAIGTATVVLQWTDNSGEGNALATDVPFVVVYNRTQNVIASVGVGGGVRSDATIDIELPANAAAGNVIYCWLAFRRADGTQVSDTVYTLVNVA